MTIEYDCSYDKIDAEETLLEDFILNQKDPYSLDLSTRISNTASDYCPILKYTISKVVQASNGKQLSNSDASRFFKIESNKLYIADFSYPYNNYTVYVQADTERVTSKELSILDVSIIDNTPKEVFTVDIEPKEVDKTFQISMKETSSTVIEDLSAVSSVKILGATFAQYS